MPLGVTNLYLLTVGGTTYDLRRVAYVRRLADPTFVEATFDWAPAVGVRFLTATFEPAYQAALIAMGGSAI